MNLSDENGDETEEFAQDAFGNVLSSAQTGAWASDPSGRHETTKEMDGDVGLYYFSQRWYDSKTGRFLSKSPFLPDKEHSFSYCNNNPISYDDAKGLISLRTIGDIIDLLEAFWDAYDGSRRACKCGEMASDIRNKMVCELRGCETDPGPVNRTDIEELCLCMMDFMPDAPWTTLDDYLEIDTCTKMADEMFNK